MIGFLTAVLALQVSPGATPPAPIIRTERTGRFVISDEIGPAVAPYMGCLLKQQGVELRGAVESEFSKPGPNGDCAQSRTEAEERADELLRGKGWRSAGERKALIEKTLVRMESFAKGISQPVAPSGPSNDPN